MASSVSKKSIVVLIVEDDVLLRMDAMEMLEEAGFEVLEAATADEAILILESRLDVNVMFTDVDMPGSMNGIKLAEAVRGRWPPIKIIATSGHFNLGSGDLPAGGTIPAIQFHGGHRDHPAIDRGIIVPAALQRSLAGDLRYFRWEGDTESFSMAARSLAKVAL